jgi:allantoicase
MVTLLGQMAEYFRKYRLGPSQHHIFMVNNDAIFTHIRLNIFPDGGVARLRVYGEVHIQVTDTSKSDLLALENGGRVIAYSDAHFGHPRNLINPGRGVNMGDGWETKRRRAPGYDWCILALGKSGKIEKIEIDTAHLKVTFLLKCLFRRCMLKMQPMHTDSTKYVLVIFT